MEDMLRRTMAEHIEFDTRLQIDPWLAYTDAHQLENALLNLVINARDAMSEGGDDFLTKPIKPRHLIATVRNRAARARNLKARMVRDSLTGLFNHTHTLQLLEDARFRAERDGQPLSFAMIDIDFFKKVNDTYGHPMGDRVIKSLALFLKQRLRKSDHIGRYGGEEFAVVMPDTDAKSAKLVLDEIRQRFAEIQYSAQPHELSCTFSCGVSQLAPELDGKLLSQQADQALYVAKHGGRNRVEIYQGD
jgi:diguanylate cyclase (GGDEF)-like protein